MSSKQHSSTRTSGRRAAASLVTASDVIGGLPQYTIDGKAQSPEFCRGAFLAKDLLAALQSSSFPRNDLAAAQRMGESIFTHARYHDKDFAKGFATALGHWLAGARHTEYVALYWAPFDSRPLSRQHVHGGIENPRRGDKLFDVKGKPVAAAANHPAYYFRAKESIAFSINDVLAYGKPITRKQFDALRRALP